VTDMNEKEFSEIYENLLELTKQRALIWTDDGNDIFQVNFPRSSVSIYLDELPHSGFEAVMNVFNEDGLLIASSSSLYEESTKTKHFNLDVTDLLNIIRSQRYKYSETAKDILGELKKLRRTEMP
jgi:hypothetical protein